MDTWSIIVTVILSLLAVAVTIIGWQRGKGPRHVLQGIGWFLLPIGLLLSGVMQLVVKGAQYTYHWLMTTYLDLQHKIGLGVIGGGVLFLLISLLVHQRTREEAAAARQARQAPIQGGNNSKALPADRAAREPASAKAAPTKAAPKAAGLSDEDAEIEALLKARGIE